MMRVVGPDVATITVVMPGLDPGIHVLPFMQNDVDARDKPGHDDNCEFAS